MAELTLHTVYKVKTGYSCPSSISRRGGRVSGVMLEVAKDPKFLSRFGKKIKAVHGRYSRQGQDETFRYVNFSSAEGLSEEAENLINEILASSEIQGVNFRFYRDHEERDFPDKSEHRSYQSGETLRQCAEQISSYLQRLPVHQPKEYYTTWEEAQEELQSRKDRARVRQEKRKAQEGRLQGLVKVFRSLGYTALSTGSSVSLDEESATQLLKDLRGT